MKQAGEVEDKGEGCCCPALRGWKVMTVGFGQCETPAAGSALVLLGTDMLSLNQRAYKEKNVNRTADADDEEEEEEDETLMSD